MYTNLAALIVKLENQIITSTEARIKIAKFCAYQERCHQEVRDKLYRYGLNKEEVELIIYELIQNDFINEERFAIAYSRGKFIYKKWGRNRILLELKRRKISDYCIKKGMREIDEEDYFNTLKELIDKKFKTVKSENAYQRKHKVALYMIQKGYEADLVWSELNNRK